MTVRYIAGSFGIVGSSPDGDSVRFTPKDPDAFTKAGIDVEMNAAGSVQLDSMRSTPWRPTTRPPPAAPSGGNLPHWEMALRPPC